MASIHYGDIVGLVHPGTNGRITPKGSHDFIDFTFSGGSGEIKNGDTVTLAPQKHEYSMLTLNQKWNINIDQEVLYGGACVVLQDPEGSQEKQMYNVYKVARDPIEHVVVLMLENRSFFRVFGYLDPNRDTYVNYTEDGKVWYSTPTDDRETPDPPHEVEYVNIATENGKPEGFVKAYQKYHQHNITKGITEADYKDVMGYTRKNFLPALHKFEDFASICSQWYCSMSGPTWPNRMFAVSGSSFNWRVTPETNAASMPALKQFLKEWYSYKPPAPQRSSIFEVLKEKNESFKVYSDNVGEFSLSWLFYPGIIDADDMGDFKKDAKAGKLPRFSFIEPNYIPNKIFKWVQNDDHPPADPLEAQTFIADVYESLRTSPKWNNTLLVVTYDEHGGFFDPLIPPAAPIPDAISHDKEGTFAKFGFRVPTVLVSPCVKKGIDNNVYDHTSVLKYVIEKWAPESVGHLGERVRLANTLPVITTPRKDAFPPINEQDISKGRFLRLNVAWPGQQSKEAPQQQKLPLSEACSIALSDPAICAKLKSVLVEKALAIKPDEVAVGIATSLDGVARAGVAALKHVVKAATPHDAEKHAEAILGKATTGIDHLLASVSGLVQWGIPNDAADSAASNVQEVLASQIRASAMFAQKTVGDNQLARSMLMAIELAADELAQNMMRKGKKV